jgi:hypothetical protein
VADPGRRPRAALGAPAPRSSRPPGAPADRLDDRPQKVPILCQQRLHILERRPKFASAWCASSGEVATARIHDPAPAALLQNLPYTTLSNKSGISHRLSEEQWKCLPNLVKNQNCVVDLIGAGEIWLSHDERRFSSQYNVALSACQSSHQFFRFGASNLGVTLHIGMMTAAGRHKDSNAETLVQGKGGSGALLRFSCRNTADRMPSTWPPPKLDPRPPSSWI